MRQPIATFCSLALVLWGYQTGLWILAIPMIVALEGREFVRFRWTMSWETLNALHVIVGFFWLLSIVCLPPTSPSPVTYAARYQLMKGLPVALFPLILAQTYCVGVGSLYQKLFKKYPRSDSQFNLYYPFFGICLLSASVTGGNNFFFLIATLVLVTGVLWFTRSPRFNSMTYYSLIGLALALSIVGAHQFYWLEANFRLPSPFRLSDLIENIAYSWQRNNPQNIEPLDRDWFDRIQHARDLEEPNNLERSPSRRSESQANSDGSETSLDSEENNSPLSNRQSLSQSKDESQLDNDIASSPTSNSNGTDSVSSDVNQDLGDSESSNQPGPQENNSVSEDSTDNRLNSPPEGASGSSDESYEAANRSGTRLGSRVNGDEKVSPLPGAIQQTGGVVDPDTSQTSIGSIGSLQQSNAILFRVTPLGGNIGNFPYPLKIREATYNRYQSGTWDAVGSTFIAQNSRGQGRWVFGDNRGKAPLSINVSEVINSSDGLLKLPMGTSEIEGLVVDSMALNQYGAVAFQRPSKVGQPLTYTVRFDPTHSLDSLPTNLDRTIPKSERSTIQQVLQKLDVDGKSEIAIVQAIATFFGKDFQYSLDLSQPKKNQTPLAAFLQDHRSGHCEYFASATSLLLREAGIPTRYVVGYSVSEFSPTDQQYLVRLRDAHAWVMAYVDGAWITVDNTPSDGASRERNGEETLEEAIAQRTPSNRGTGAQDRRVSERSTVSEDSFDQAGRLDPPKEKGGDSISSKDAESWSGFLESIKQRVLKAWAFVESQFESLSASLWFGSFIALGVAIALTTAFVIWRLYRNPQGVLKRSRNRRLSFQKSKSNAMEYNFEHVEAQLKILNLQRSPSETPMRWVVRLEQALPELKFMDLKTILELHYRHRFDPNGLSEEDCEMLQTLIQDWLVDFESQVRPAVFGEPHSKKHGYPE